LAGGSHKPLDRLSLVSGRKVRIPNRHANRLVTHKLLHGSQVNSGHDKAAGKGVPEIMPVKVGEPG